MNIPFIPKTRIWKKYLFNSFIFVVVAGFAYFTTNFYKNSSRLPIHIEGDYSQYFEGVKKNEILIYTTSWCPVCKETKNYFRQRNISFQERDIEVNAIWKLHHFELGTHSVPVILIGNHLINGFDSRIVGAIIGEKLSKSIPEKNLKASNFPSK